MSDTQKGNDAARWHKLLNGLDEKLQLGLLDKLNKVSLYHFENNILHLQPSCPEDEQYLKKDSVFQQLELLAQDIIKTDKVLIKKCP